MKQNDAEKLLAMERYEPNSIAFQSFGMGDVKNVTLPFKVLFTLVQGEWRHQTVLCAVIPANEKPLDVATVCGDMANPKAARRHTPRDHQAFLMAALRDNGATVQHHNYANIGPYIDIIYEYQPNRVYQRDTTEFLKQCVEGIQDAEWEPVTPLD